MSLFVSSLNSGSNGNCYYVGNYSDAVLVDAGISCRETERRMARVGLDMSKVRAIFISHEHTDHISGVTVLAKKYQLPVYITENTLRSSRLAVDPRLVYTFRPGVEVRVAGLKIAAFSKCHDGCDPHSFTVSSEAVRVGIFTDIGKVCDNLVAHFKQCHAAFLEANYDEQLLDQGRYPIYLKNRIRNGMGHLSNTQALKLCLDHRPAYMSHLFLSHLSKENNCPNLARELFTTHIRNMEIVVASRHEPTAVYTIHPFSAISFPLPVQRWKKENRQLSLF